MSFILDALRKSENERQQSAVPGIADVPAVVHQARIPSWVLGVIATLSLCIVALGWAWVRSTRPMAPELPRTEVDSPVPSASSRPPAQVRNLAREARQPVSDAVLPNAVPGGSNQARTPTAEPAPAPAEFASAPVTMTDMLASGTVLPELNLELHVFSTTPAERFVFINSTKYQEGQTLKEGPRVLAITEEGVILRYRDQSFLLPTD